MPVHSRKSINCRFIEFNTITSSCCLVREAIDLFVLVIWNQFIAMYHLTLSYQIVLYFVYYSLNNKHFKLTWRIKRASDHPLVSHEGCVTDNCWCIIVLILYKFMFERSLG